MDSRHVNNLRAGTSLRATTGKRQTTRKTDANTPVGIGGCSHQCWLSRADRSEKAAAINSSSPPWQVGRTFKTDRRWRTFIASGVSREVLAGVRGNWKKKRGKTLRALLRRTTRERGLPVTISIYGLPNSIASWLPFSPLACVYACVRVYPHFAKEELTREGSNVPANVWLRACPSGLCRLRRSC